MVKRKSKKTEHSEAEKKRKIQIKEQNNILKNIFIIFSLVIVGFLLFLVISKSMNNFEYKGVKFEIVKFCDAGPPCLVTYKTSLPVKVTGDNILLTTKDKKTDDYNFYLRNDPRKSDLDFNDTILFRNLMVLNFTDPFICEGKGAIAAANLIQLYNILGINFVADENATCGSSNMYTLVKVVPGSKTKIENPWPACYTITIKDCEILEGTEKFMIETLVEVNKILNENSGSS